MGRKYNELLIGGEIIPYSTNIDCNYDDRNQRLEINIKHPDCNMQYDYADFEAIAFSAWSLFSDLNIVLKYNCLEWGHKFPLPIEGKKVKSNILHYMRFLYRAYKMRSLYGKFTIHNENNKEVDTFARLYESALKNKKFCMTIPNKESSVGDGLEARLEKWFVLKSYDKPEGNVVVNMLKQKTGATVLYDQFPCGLFYDSFPPDDAKRIFPRGAFDLWSITESKDLCLFELKKPTNVGLGIISELFFYSCVCKDFKEPSLEKGSTKIRGFDVFLSANNKIKAYFLIPQFHPFIEKHKDEIIKIMNQRNDDVKYDYIKFDIDNILEDNSFQNLDVEWNSFKK